VKCLPWEFRWAAPLRGIPQGEPISPGRQNRRLQDLGFMQDIFYTPFTVDNWHNFFLKEIV